MISNNMNVMFNLPTTACSQEEIDSWNSDTLFTEHSRYSNYYQCKDMVNINYCTQAHATDE